MPKVVAYVPKESVVHRLVGELSPQGWEVVRLDTASTSAETLHGELADADFMMFFYGKVTEVDPFRYRRGRRQKNRAKHDTLH